MNENLYLKMSYKCYKYYKYNNYDNCYIYLISKNEKVTLILMAIRVTLKKVMYYLLHRNFKI